MLEKLVDPLVRDLKLLQWRPRMVYHLLGHDLLVIGVILVWEEGVPNGEEVFSVYLVWIIGEIGIENGFGYMISIQNHLDCELREVR